MISKSIVKFLWSYFYIIYFYIIPPYPRVLKQLRNGLTGLSGHGSTIYGYMTQLLEQYEPCPVVS